MYELTVEDSFSAAHQLVSSKSPCENLHGHNWKVQVIIHGENLDKKVGWIMDFQQVKKSLQAELAKYDHKVLNEVMKDSPSAENIARSVYQGLKKQLPVYKVIVFETEKASAAYFEE